MYIWYICIHKNIVFLYILQNNDGYDNTCDDVGHATAVRPEPEEVWQKCTVYFIYW